MTGRIPATTRCVLKPCANPACSALVERGKCAKCAAKAEQRRGTTAQRGYDADHKVLRVRCFVRDEWRCVDCGWEPDIVRLARLAEVGMPPAERVLAELRLRFMANETHLHADHQIDIDLAPHLRLDLGNLRTRCNRCHAKKTCAEHAGSGNQQGRNA